MLVPDYAVKPLSECQAGTLVKIAARGGSFLAIVGPIPAASANSKGELYVIALEPVRGSGRNPCWLLLGSNTQALAIGLKWQLEINPRSWAEQSGALQTANGSIFACVHGLFMGVHAALDQGFNGDSLLINLENWSIPDGALRGDIYMSKFIAIEWSISTYDQNQKCRADLLRHTVER